LSPISGDYDADVMIFDTNNQSDETINYQFTFSSANDFQLDLKYFFIYRISFLYRNYRTSKTYRGQFRYDSFSHTEKTVTYSLRGFQLTSDITNTLFIEGSNDEDFANVTLIGQIDDYDGSSTERDVTTDLRYIRFRKNVAFSTSFIPYAEDISDSNKETAQGFGVSSRGGNDRGIFIPAPYPVLDNSIVDFINSFPTTGEIYLPNRRMGYYNLPFPPEFNIVARSFLNLTSELYDLASAKFEFSRNVRTPEPDVEVTMGLQLKGSQEEWFDTIENIGEIKSSGKTIHEIKQFSADPHNSVLIPKGTDSLRFFFSADKQVVISVSATLT